MAQLVLSSIGSALGGPIGGSIGAAIGSAIDKAALSSLSPPRQTGPRLTQVRITSVSEGAPMAAVYGRARVSGQVIWAAQFKEHRTRSGGGKGGARTVSQTYSLSFAVALCEGPIDGLGRVWADGQPLDLTGVVMRLHRGGADQTPDALIEAVEGQAPAYRGLAYVVFEDLPLAPYGNRPPQLSFEVLNRARSTQPALEDQLKGICLIPGAGEFVYATESVFRRQSLTRTVSETVHNTDGRPDLLVSLDQLQAQLPNVTSVMLVTSWFGTDLACGRCKILPGVEGRDRVTLPVDWSAGGLDRASAHLISQSGGGPAFGGTPSDASILAAIAELKARGFKVGLYPFILMDVPEGSSLPDPYGGAAQGAYPWRGRITCDPAPGRPGTAYGTAAATAQVQAFFGPASTDWGLRRMVLHYAQLAQQAGGVDTFLIGSELRGVTQLRGPGATYPAVAALRTLAQDCRTILGPSTALSYAADWTEYFGHQPQDGSGDVRFHLDPLWADPAISFVGIDWYAPLADWRDGETHLDRLAGYKGPQDLAYLASQVFGGEGADWFYASNAHRAAQIRTPITDGAYGQPWVFAPKALKSWWSQLHHDRPGGVRQSIPTAWVPQSKPVRLIEFGCPAVDKGANSPNLFVDAKSAESALPPFSSGARDDLGQRRALEAVLSAFSLPANNPMSSVYGGPMVASDALHGWCWDARPFPDFPARTGIWSDGVNWSRGHWLNGRAGAMPLGDLVKALGQRAGVDLSVEGLSGLVEGYCVDRPMRLRDALEPLALTYGFDAAERDGQACLVASRGRPVTPLATVDLAMVEEALGLGRIDRDLEPLAEQVRVRFIDGQADYQTGAVVVRRPLPQDGAALDLDLPVVMTEACALTTGQRVLAQMQADRDRVTVPVGPLAALKAEPGDVVAPEAFEGYWRVIKVSGEEQPSLTLTRVAAVDEAVAELEPDWRLAAPLQPPGPPVFLLLDLPPLAGQEEDSRPIAALAAEPWRAMEVWAGPSAQALSSRDRIERPAALGQTLTPLSRGPRDRLDRAARLTVQIEGEALQSRSLPEVLAGANALAIQGPQGEWEVLQFTDAVLIAPETYRLSGLLRGQGGSDPAMADLNPAGAAVVVLSPDLPRVSLARAERGLPLVWAAALAGGSASGDSLAQTSLVWRGLAERPWSPCHLRLTSRADGALAVSWIRRTRLGGDDWGSGDARTGDVPLSEAAELYRVQVFKGSQPLRSVETAQTGWLYGAADQAADFLPAERANIRITVAQGSAVTGWGPTTQVFLL
jgi:hypothetical protein